MTVQLKLELDLELTLIFTLPQFSLKATTKTNQNNLLGILLKIVEIPCHYSVEDG